MMKISVFLILHGLLFFLCSCAKDWLDEKSNKQQAIPSTLKDFQALLNNEELNFETTATLGEIASDGHHTTEAAWMATTNVANLNAYIWANSRPYSDFYWTSGFKNIFVTNVVLDGLSGYNAANNTEKESWNDIKGQALFHRAFAFYRAAQIWAPPYNPATANRELGVPLRVEADVSVQSVRSNVQETYAQIVNDLVEASNLLPRKFVAKTRPHRYCSFALLARVYLSMREYKLAGEYADSCLKFNASLIDYNELSTSANFVGNVNNNPEVIFFQYFFTTNFLTSACFIDSALYASYEDNDLRKVVFFKKNASGGITFKGNYHSSASSLFSGLSNDEMYLIRAESYARAGQVNLAMRDLNDLLRTRWKKVDGASTYVDQTAVSANEALEKIINERKKSLMMRGLRWTDLRRLNFEDMFSQTLIREIGGNTYTLEPGSFRYTFPIPDGIISSSTMQQNPGW